MTSQRRIACIMLSVLALTLTTSAAVARKAAAYATTFLGFPWEAIPNAADRQAVLGRMTNACQ